MMETVNTACIDRSPVPIVNAATTKNVRCGEEIPLSLPPLACGSLRNDN